MQSWTELYLSKSCKFKGMFDWTATHKTNKLTKTKNNPPLFHLLHSYSMIVKKGTKFSAYECTHKNEHVTVQRSVLKYMKLPYSELYHYFIKVSTLAQGSCSQSFQVDEFRIIYNRFNWRRKELDKCIDISIFYLSSWLKASCDLLDLLQSRNSTIDPCLSLTSPILLEREGTSKDF